MRKFYLVGAIVVGILVLVASFAQLGATCTLYLFPTGSPAFLVFLQMASIGAIFGGLLVLYWKTPKSEEDEDASEEVGNDNPPPTSGV